MAQRTFLARLIQFFKKITRFFFQSGAIIIRVPREGQCVTWDANGVVTIRVTIAGTPNPAMNHVFRVSKPGPVAVNGDYAYPGPITIQQGDHGSPAACVDLLIELVEIDPVTMARTVLAARTVQLCPTCP